VKQPLSPQTAQKILQQRIAQRPSLNRLDIHSDLLHFALITYALPKARLEPHIPTNRFDIPEFDINGKKLALMSAVPFWDADFRFGLWSSFDPKSSPNAHNGLRIAR
jgi:hypothetical protein